MQPASVVKPSRYLKMTLLVTSRLGKRRQYTNSDLRHHQTLDYALMLVCYHSPGFELAGTSGPHDTMCCMAQSSLDPAASGALFPYVRGRCFSEVRVAPARLGPRSLRAAPYPAI
jgi:hypothetical protein